MMAMGLEDFQLGKVIYKGSFTTVQVIKEKASGRFFALKSVDKGYHANKKTQYLLEAEEDLRSQNASDWLVSLHYCFHERRKIHFVTEYLPGGNFFELLKRQGGYLSESTATFYLGELVLAINAVHSIGYAHRNLRPTNILVDGRGHIKLTGFGSVSKIAASGMVATQISVDSATYEAPEILRTLGNETLTHGVASDFWSLGVIAFEVITGIHPFRSSSPLSAFKKITAKKKKGSVKVPSALSEACRDFIGNLLLEQDERMTYSDCIKHPFFNDLIWDGLRHEDAPIPSFIRTKETEDLGGYTAPTTTEAATADENTPPIVENDTEIQPRCMRRISSLTFVRPAGHTILRESQPNDGRAWSITALVDQQKPSTPVNVEQAAADLMCEENEKLKADVQTKTDQLIDRIEEIQALQTQLQWAKASIEEKEQQLVKSAKENQSLKMELHHASTELSHEKTCRTQLEKKLYDTSAANASIIKARAVLHRSVMDGEDSDEVFELREELVKVMEAGSRKDDIITDLSVQVKILKNQLYVQELHNQIQTRRDEAGINIFGNSYKLSIEELEEKLKQIEQMISVGEGRKMDEGKLKSFIDSKGQELKELRCKIDEQQQGLESTFEEVKSNRKVYAEALGQTQVAINNTLAELLEEDAKE